MCASWESAFSAFLKNRSNGLKIVTSPALVLFLGVLLSSTTSNKKQKQKIDVRNKGINHKNILSDFCIVSLFKMSDTYGQFFEAVEEINFPSSGSSNDLLSEKLENKQKNYGGKPEELGIIGKVLKTMDKINNNQFESTNSLASMASTNSMSSMSSVQSDGDFINTNKIFTAVQSLTLNNYGSTNSLASNDELGSFSKQGGAEGSENVVTQFLHVVDEFMHNHDPQTPTPASDKNMRSSKSTDSVAEEIETVFPKFC